MSFKGIIYLVVSLLSFSVGHLTEKAGINSGVDPAVFGFLNIFFGLIFVGILWFSFRKSENLKFEKKNLKHLIIIGVLASGLSYLVGMYALNYTTATNKGIMQSMYTAITLIFAYFWLGERLPKLFYPLFLVMIIGLVMLTSKGFLVMPNKGDWLLFSTIPLIGFCNVYAKKSMEKINPLTIGFGRYIFGALFLLMMVPLLSLTNIGTVENGLIWIILTGIFGAVRVITFYKGMELEGPSMAATILSISPTMTAIGEFLFLEKTFTIWEICGLILVISAAIFISRLKADYKITTA